jgi:preprotein translocase subunit Sec61beta
MSKDNKIHMPGAFGGLMRYDEEFSSRFMITPTQVIVFLVVILLFVLALKLFFPITPAA